MKLAAATDDPVPEVVDALAVNHERAKALAERLAIATRPAMDAAAAERRERLVGAQVDRMREKLTAGEAREVFGALFPSGLRFKVGNGLWQIEGAASVPTVHGTDALWTSYRRRPRRRVIPSRPASPTRQRRRQVFRDQPHRHQVASRLSSVDE